jgi:hypothetical protein
MSACPPSTAEIVPVLCPRCYREVLYVTDGPGLNLLQPLRGQDAIRTGDVCGTCPNCGARVCVRILRVAA